MHARVAKPAGLFNRRFFFEQGKLLFKSAEKSGLPLACVQGGRNRVAVAAV